MLKILSKKTPEIYVQPMRKGQQGERISLPVSSPTERETGMRESAGERNLTRTIEQFRYRSSYGQISLSRSI